MTRFKKKIMTLLKVIDNELLCWETELQISTDVFLQLFSYSLYLYRWSESDSRILVIKLSSWRKQVLNLVNAVVIQYCIFVLLFLKDLTLKWK